MPNNNTRTIKGVERAFDILEFVRHQNSVSVTDVARELDIAVSTAHQYLRTLEMREFLVREEDEYHLALRFLDYGESARTRQPAHQLIEEKVEEIAQETNERAQFVVSEHGYGVVLYTTTGDRAVQTDVTLGGHVLLHATAAGKAILAHLPDEEVKWIIDKHGLPEVTENTITDYDELMATLEDIRERGVAYNNQEDTDGLRAVGVPVKNPNDGILGALSVSGPTHRLEDDALSQEIVSLLLGTANELELRIEYMD